MKQELVEAWMTQNPVTITPDTELPAIQDLMTQLDIRRLPVVDKGQLVGIVTQGDMRSAIALSISEPDELWLNLCAEEIMSANPLTITPDTTIGEAALIMRTNKVSGLPVVNDEGHIIGIITESDIFDMVINEWYQK